MNLIDYAHVIRRLWWILVVGIVVGAVAGEVLALLTPRSYQVQSTVVISVLGDGSPGALQSGNVFALQRAGTYAKLATTRAVLGQVVSQVGPSVTLSELQGSVSATAVPDTGIININVVGRDPQLVQEIAVAVPEALSSVAKQTDTPGIASTIQITPIDQPLVPTTAYAPQPRLSILVGAAIGLLLALAVIVAVNLADGRIRSIGEIPSGRRFASRTVVPGAGRRGENGAERAESIKRLRSNLRYGPGLPPTISVMPVAVGEPEGVAWALAAELAESGSPVLLVDVNRSASPDAERFAELPPTTGLAEVLAGSAPLDQQLVKLDGSLSYLGPGQFTDETGSRLAGDEMGALLDQLKGYFTHIVLRCPPVLAGPDAADVAAIADGTVLVVTAAMTTRTQLLYAEEILDGVRADDVSLVLDGISANDLRSAVSPGLGVEQEFTRS